MDALPSDILLELFQRSLHSLPTIRATCALWLAHIDGTVLGPRPREEATRLAKLLAAGGQVAMLKILVLRRPDPAQKRETMLAALMSAVEAMQHGVAASAYRWALCQECLSETEADSVLIASIGANSKDSAELVGLIVSPPNEASRPSPEGAAVALQLAVERGDSRAVKHIIAVDLVRYVDMAASLALATIRASTSAYDIGIALVRREASAV